MDTHMDALDLEIFVKADKHRRKRLRVQFITIPDQGIVQLREAYSFDIQLAGSHMAMLKTLTNHSRLVMTVLDNGRPRIRWVFSCKITDVCSGDEYVTGTRRRKTAYARVEVLKNTNRSTPNYYAMQ